MEKKTAGNCMHLVSDFICTHGKHQNFPCPYRNDPKRCGCSVIITKQMETDWREKGCMHTFLKK